MKKTWWHDLAIHCFGKENFIVPWSTKQFKEILREYKQHPSDIHAHALYNEQSSAWATMLERAVSKRELIRYKPISFYREFLQCSERAASLMERQPAYDARVPYYASTMRVRMKLAEILYSKGPETLKEVEETLLTGIKRANKTTDKGVRLERLKQAHTAFLAA